MLCLVAVLDLVEARLKLPQRVADLVRRVSTKTTTKVLDPQLPITVKCSWRQCALQDTQPLPQRLVILPIVVRSLRLAFSTISVVTTVLTVVIFFTAANGMPLPLARAAACRASN